MMKLTEALRIKNIPDVLHYDTGFDLHFFEHYAMANLFFAKNYIPRSSVAETPIDTSLDDDDDDEPIYINLGDHLEAMQEYF